MAKAGGAEQRAVTNGHCSPLHKEQELSNQRSCDFLFSELMWDSCSITPKLQHRGEYVCFFCIPIHLFWAGFTYVPIGCGFFTASNSHDMRVCLACNGASSHRSGAAALHSPIGFCAGANSGKNSELIRT